MTPFDLIAWCAAVFVAAITVVGVAGIALFVYGMIREAFL